MVLVVSGITLFAYADGFQPSNIIGVILSVGSAIGAATYKVCNLQNNHTDHSSCIIIGSTEVACQKCYHLPDDPLSLLTWLVQYTLAMADCTNFACAESRGDHQCAVALSLC